MAFYIKVTKQVADKLGVAGIRNSTADGNVLLWQADVAGFPGDTVFDPFLGSGTTGVACVKTKRDFIGIELDEVYFKIAEQRIRETEPPVF